MRWGQIGSCLLPIATSGGSQLWIAMLLVDWAHNFGHEGLTSILTASGLIDLVTENSENRGLLNASLSHRRLILVTLLLLNTLAH